MLGNGKEKRHLKYEISHCRLEVELLEQDVMNVKEEAGAFAYSLWSEEKFYAEALDEYFIKVKERENDIKKKRDYIAVWEEQLEKLNEKKRGEEPGERAESEKRVEPEKIVELEKRAESEKRGELGERAEPEKRGESEKRAESEKRGELGERAEPEKRGESEKRTEPGEGTESKCNLQLTETAGQKALPITCSVCGAQYKLPANFCRKCGSPLLKQAAAELKE